MTLEAVHQKGGYYFCQNCTIHSCQTDDITCTYQKSILSYSDKQQLVISGNFGKKNSISGDTLPFEKHSQCELKTELLSRNINLSGLKETKKDLKPVLGKVLKGSKRVPILLLRNPTTDLEDVCLKNYEISLVECMHDIAYHIDNILEELPHHLNREGDKEKFISLLSQLNEEKQRKRCCDKRKILLCLSKELKGELDGYVNKLLSTLVEIQRILYLPDDLRSQKEILRLHNCCFFHFLLLKRIFVKKFVKITHDKLYGKYSHNLLVHSPLQIRLVSGDSINVEDEERVFNTIRNISNTTTNNWPGHIIANIFTRLQVTFRCKERYGYNSTTNTIYNEINEIGKSLYSGEKNTLFQYHFIKDYPQEWFAHLERISDYLVLGNAWWQKNEFGVEFFDYDSDPQEDHLKPKLHHFRSSNVKSVAKELKGHWDEILTSNIQIPSHVIFEGEENEPVRSKPTNYLNPFLQLDNYVPKRIQYDLDTSDENPEEYEEILIDFNKESTCNDLSLDHSTGNFKTNCCYLLSLVIGQLPLLEKYDHGLNAYSSRDTPNTFLEGVLDKLKNELKILFDAELSNCKKKVKDWERNFISSGNYMSVPTQEDYEKDAIIKSCCDKINISKMIINKIFS